MKVLVVTSSFPESPEDGVCGYVFDLARRLAEDFGHDVRVLAPGGPRAGDAGFAPVRVERVLHPWPGARRLGPGSDMGAALRASAVARAEAASFSAALLARTLALARGADVVLSHWLVPSGAAAAAARRRRRPHVAVAHGGDVHLLARAPGGALAARRVAARSDAMVFVTRDLRDRFRSLLGGAHMPRAEVVPMGAELGPPSDAAEVARARDRAGGRPVALFLGRLDPIKGAGVLIEAAGRDPGVVVWVAGDGPEAPALRAAVEAARLPVSFLGQVGRRQRRLALDACDVVVVPSMVEASGRSEGAPVVCAEALAAGKPVVASRSGGIEELIEDGRTGLLVPPGDAAALAAALARLAADAPLRGALAEAAAREGPAHTMARTAGRFDRILRGVGSRESEVGRTEAAE